MKTTPIILKRNKYLFPNERVDNKRAEVRVGGSQAWRILRRKYAIPEYRSLGGVRFLSHDIQTALDYEEMLEEKAARIDAELERLISTNKQYLKYA